MTGKHKPQDPYTADDESADMGNDDAEDNNMTFMAEKYKDQVRQIILHNMDLPWLTLKYQIDNQIELNPEVQRRDRWDAMKQSRYIESVIMNVPIPPVLLGEEELGKYVVLDGRQRLNAAKRFLGNELRLQGLKIWPELNGLNWKDIKLRGLAGAIERRYLSAILISNESSREVKYEIFDRINTGGVPATQMEIRNAIFPGPYNNMLHALSAFPAFRKLWGIPNSEDLNVLEKSALYREMGDLELVHRFFALRDGSLHGMTFKDRLSYVMNEQNEAMKKDGTLEKKLCASFYQAIDNCMLIFGEDAFRPSKYPDRKSGRSAPYADALMQALSDIPTHELEKDSFLAKRIKASFMDLVTNDGVFLKSIQSGTNSQSAIKNRIEIAKKAVNLSTEYKESKNTGKTSKNS